MCCSRSQLLFYRPLVLTHNLRHQEHSHIRHLQCIQRIQHIHIQHPQLLNQIISCGVSHDTKYQTLVKEVFLFTQLISEELNISFNYMKISLVLPYIHPNSAENNAKFEINYVLINRHYYKTILVQTENIYWKQRINSVKSVLNFYWLFWAEFLRLSEF